MCSRILQLFGKFPQWNLHVKCNVNRTTFQSGLSSLLVSCKGALIFCILHLFSKKFFILSPYLVLSYWSVLKRKYYTSGQLPTKSRNQQKNFDLLYFRQSQMLISKALRSFAQLTDIKSWKVFNSSGHCGCSNIAKLIVTQTS